MNLAHIEFRKLLLGLGVPSEVREGVAPLSPEIQDSGQDIPYSVVPPCGSLQFPFGIFFFSP
ncbi:hypothetical protein SK128_012982 [Halocaridina rubra]|uniref:Uncharacterized protein n=1 Tax=Halocaridina rubra TaxID=373956 RepID=A0AAN8XQZ9_HALRR